MAEIKIRGDISGSTTIKAPDSGSDEVIELSSALASKLPYSYGTATPTASEDGFLWYDENDTPPTPKFWDGAVFQAFSGGGKIIQVVRATDTMDRSTTSSTYVDASLSVTITPTDATSAILLIATHSIDVTRGASPAFARAAITDNSDNPISGAQNAVLGGATTSQQIARAIVGYATPATTSATTYKLRFRVSSASTTVTLYNSTHQTGQLFAIEVGA